jgi:tetratricopeptide (TPR) repeat protein
LDKRQNDKVAPDDRKEIVLRPDDTKAIFDAFMGRYDQSILHYTKALEANPKDVRAYTLRGGVYLTSGQYDEAISDYTKALEINPMFVPAYNERGLAYSEKGQFEQALSDSTELLS